MREKAVQASDVPSRIRDGGSKWIDILMALRDRPLTLASLASQMGTSPGAVGRQLHALRDEGFVKSDSPSGGHGAQYWTDPAILNDVDGLRDAAQPTGVIKGGQHVMWVRTDAILPVMRAFELADLMGWAVWVALMRGGGLLVVLDRDTPQAALGRIQAVLEAEKLTYSWGSIDEPQNRNQWQRLLEAWRGAPDS